MVVKDTVTPEWTGTHDMAIGQDVSALGIDDKASSLTAH
jgi:hypothetical protein